MKTRTLSPLQLALGVSIAVHAGLLTLRFAAPQTFNRVFEDTPLEVILVNARTDEAPDKATAIAQANMAGGGELDQGRATSPLPPAMVSIQGDSGNQERELLDMQMQQNLILSQVKQALAAMPAQNPQQTATSDQQVQQQERRRQLVQLLGEIERRINNQNARPRKRYISPSTREAVYAVYYDHLRRAIEDKGTENFPQINGRKLYGELTMIVNVNHDGQVLSTEVVQSSGVPALDQRAQAIAASAAPFGRFGPQMRRQADQIAVVSRFRFTREDTLETKVSTP
ncbi:hypothetical protein GALL_448070 [mine drainage metagenome]|uniref:TonB C-terminal domain-containing protein n=1 Tax=mine drainage metagenome TaxID=410659 RepID=A0A1J5Q7V4_9ZZZZ